jgi:RHS repeat-associated protein
MFRLTVGAKSAARASAFVSLLVVAALSAATVSAQKTAARPDRGTDPAGAYSVSDVENINLQNGNVQLSIPLASLPPIAGGHLSFTLRAIYNSKLWNVTRSEQAGGALPYRTYVVDTPQLSDTGGWSLFGGYVIFTRDAREDFNYQIPPSPDPSDSEAVVEYNRLTQHNWYKVVLRTPDGAEHELRPAGTNFQMYGGADYPRSYLWGYHTATPAQVGAPVRYNSTDGTYLSAVINPSGNAVEWTVFLPDGTQVVRYSDGTQRIRDTEGNSIKIYSDNAGTHYQDEQTGREIRVSYDPAGSGGYGQYQVWYQTVGGVSEHVDINYGQTVVQGKLYKVQDWNPSVVTETGQQGDVCPRQQQLTAQTLDVVREIVYPATEPNAAVRHFTFGYDSDTTESATTPGAFFSCGGPTQTYTRQASNGMGALNQMVTPTGASAGYTYTLASTHDFVGVDGPDEMVRETITAKTLTHDGGTDSWSYSIPTTGFGTSSSVTNPDGSSSAQLYYPINPDYARTYGASIEERAGLVYYVSDGVTETYRHWAMRGSQVATGSTNYTAVNPLVDAEYTSFVGSTRMSARSYEHDYNGNVTQETDYDWFDSSQVTRDGQGVPAGVPAGLTPLRVANTTYYNQAADASSPNYYALRALTTGVPSLLGAVQQASVGASVTQYSYDGQNYGYAPTAGNVTSTSSFDDRGDTDPSNDRWVTTGATYDTYGNRLTATDANGNITSFFYEDATHAAPTRVVVVVDPQNGTGQQTTLAAYDFWTGLVKQATDANNQITTIDYTNQLLGTVDPFGRAGIVTGPAVMANGLSQHHKTFTTYEDVARRVTVSADLNAEGDGLLKSRTTSDQLGRPVLAEKSEDGSTYTISAQTAYEQMGRVAYASTPMRAAAPATTDAWTRTTKDAAGRVVEVATFPGTQRPAAGTDCTTATGCTGKVTSLYNGEFVTVTDQVGKTRRTRSDALGRLVRVDEPDASSGNLDDAGGNPVQPTFYTYDVLGNLTVVRQGAQLQSGVYTGGQTRSFTYSSLSRLSSATNPESGTLSYDYDPAGNLVRKTDARGVSAHFEYDGLSRVTRRWYNGSGSLAATTNNSPALPAGVGTSDEVRYFYDSQGLPTGAPATFDRGYAVGRLVATTYGGGSSGTYVGFDAVGKPLRSVQQIGGVNYTVGSITYNLAGAMTSEAYPSGHIVTTSYDPAGRESSVSGTLGDGATRAYSSGLSYSPSGALQQEQFGTDTPLYHKLLYNSRSQLAEIRVGTAALPDTGWQRGAIINHYSDAAGAWGATGGGPDNNGNLHRQDIFIPNFEGLDYAQGGNYGVSTESFSYDSLNRLSSASESSAASPWTQSYTYDRFGNRTINATSTVNAPATQFEQDAYNPSYREVAAPSNRLYAPGDGGRLPGQKLMDYDAAGNLIYDGYSGAGARTYDAENRMTVAQINTSQSATYAYDADGHRVRRNTGGGEVWQVYGVGGELLTEYAAGASPSQPQEEYGYRGGELLVTATAPTGGWGAAPAFDDNPLVARQTLVQSKHITQLRSAIDSLRSHLGLAGYSWQAHAGVHDLIKADPIIEMRTALDQALGAPAGGYSPGLAQWQPIQAIHIQELRNRVLAAWQGGGGGVDVRWLVADQLGTPRMVIDKTGSLSGVRRHDYFPFGEEILPDNNWRNTAHGYGAVDDVRQKFTSKERDGETGLDYFGARYFASMQGRFTSVDPSNKSIEPSDPQTLNRYSYTKNNPLRYIDKNGKWPTETHHEFIADAFYGLTDEEKSAIQYGSNLVDTYFGTGRDFPITLAIDEAPKHAMTPEGMSTEDAYNASMKFAADMADEARTHQIFGTSKDGEMNLKALTAFGQGAHMYMDSTSPSHKGWQLYSMPKMEVEVAGGVKIYVNDWKKFYQEMQEHAKLEERKPTNEEKALTLMLLRAYYLTTFGNRAFQRAVPQAEDRQAAYDYLKQNGIKYQK